MAGHLRIHWNRRRLLAFIFFHFQQKRIRKPPVALRIRVVFGPRKIFLYLFPRSIELALSFPLTAANYGYLRLSLWRSLSVIGAVYLRAFHTTGIDMKFAHDQNQNRFQAGFYQLFILTTSSRSVLFVSSQRAIDTVGYLICQPLRGRSVFFQTVSGRFCQTSPSMSNIPGI